MQHLHMSPSGQEYEVAPATRIHINDEGMRQMAQALALRHKAGAQAATPGLLRTYALHVELNWGMDQFPGFEISEYLSRSGKPEKVTLTPEGYEVLPEEDEQGATP